MASSSSSCVNPQAKYDVFLSFRGEDTRDSFTSHLYAALCRKPIKTFIDYVGLKRGAEISRMLFEAIEESKISVILFSEDYAASRWCLEELEKIIECKDKYDQMVIPVFYHVNPSDVKMQTGSFKHAFGRHEERFRETPEKVQRWKAALTEASCLSGWNSSVTKPEAKLVEEIVKDILKKLNMVSSSSDSDGLVGVNSHIEKINSLLCIESDFLIVGIWGMGGIGKTTIVGEVFNQISSQFEGCCFVPNVREKSESNGGLFRLREQILSEILEENIKIGTPNIPRYIKKRLQYKRVLIVLDDVNDMEQLEILVGGLGQFSLGSRIIITTRDKQVLHSYGVHSIYEVKGMNNNEALQLFCNFAFRQNYPCEDLVELSNKVIDYAKGNPLALKVLGSSLHRKRKRDWESVLYNLKKICDPKIHYVLKISYDKLNREEKNIFLDIAFFFKGENRDYVTNMLDGCYYSLDLGLSNLIDKSLITTVDNRLEMHDLLQEMGLEIVCQESIKDPGKRSRLRYHEDVHDMLKYNKGTDSVEGLLLDLSKIRGMQLSSGAFANMSNLRLLRFYSHEFNKKFGDVSKVHLPQGLKNLSNELRDLRWDGFPCKKLPSKFIVENLVELRLPYSKVEQLWKGTKNVSKLKLVSLHNSQCLYEIPNLSDATGLEVINLSFCESLKIIFPKIPGNIKDLDLSGTAIEEIPTSIHKMKYLHKLHLANCSKLESFPEILEKMKCLEVLTLSRATKIKELPSSIENLIGLRDLVLHACKNLETLPSSICNLTSLIQLDISDCSKLETLPKNLGNLKSLKSLFAYRCRGLVLPPLSGLSSLTALDLSFCNLMDIPEDICCLSSLEFLNLGGNKFGTLPTSIKQLYQLKCLWMSDCKMIQSLPELPLRLEHFKAMNCEQLQSLPEPPSSFEELDASELEILFEHSKQSPWMSIRFFFTNSPKLNQNACSNFLAKSPQRIQLMAATILRLCYEKVFDEVPGINFCYPGSEIPKWFSCQNSGSLVTIGLHDQWFTRSFIGFALCVVVAFEEGYNDMGLLVRCNYRFKSNYTPSVGRGFEFRLEVTSFDKVFIDSDHIVLGYSPCMDVMLRKSHYTTVSFEFSPISVFSNEPPMGCKVKYCGVSPLYAQPNETQTSILFEKIVATNDDSCYLGQNNTSDRWDEEAGEPYNKKIC